MRNNEEDSSSSENEISVDILKEAVDQQFFNETLYATKKIKIIPQSGKKKNKCPFYVLFHFFYNFCNWYEILNILQRLWKYCDVFIICHNLEVETSKLSPRFLIAKRQEDYFTNFGVSTTLQNFIAKKLSETLERWASKSLS